MDLNRCITTHTHTWIIQRKITILTILLSYHIISDVSKKPTFVQCENKLKNNISLSFNAKQAANHDPIDYNPVTKIKLNHNYFQQY